MKIAIGSMAGSPTLRTSSSWSSSGLAKTGERSTRFSMVWRTADLITIVDMLTPEARIIQDVLHHSLMFKAWDTKKITAQLSMVTFCIMAGRDFNVSDLILSMMRYTFRLKFPDR
ncbi:hypothetical protein KSP39_PZI007292 [Platanthera zijinensis]|uniref:Uncharacterized protein n=1 Tax=Platanthera zijinensis TaxID=2320716 RepID=A0AAP0GA92_9ASPA